MAGQVRVDQNCTYICEEENCTEVAMEMVLLAYIA